MPFRRRADYLRLYMPRHARARFAPARVTRLIIIIDAHYLFACHTFRLHAIKAIIFFFRAAFAADADATITVNSHNITSSTYRSSAIRISTGKNRTYHTHVILYHLSSHIDDYRCHFVIISYDFMLPPFSLRLFSCCHDAPLSFAYAIIYVAIIYYYAMLPIC